MDDENGERGKTRRERWVGQIVQYLVGCRESLSFILNAIGSHGWVSNKDAKVRPLLQWIKEVC